MKQVFQDVVRRWSAWLDQYLDRQYAGLHANSRPQGRMLALRATEPEASAPGETNGNAALNPPSGS
ncbi:MAG TPA: hypothetical protein VED01_26050 [Burkholderiales bacterium]|nr:hypothetical protein [Burkholderiales bacterium]